MKLEWINDTHNDIYTAKVHQDAWIKVVSHGGGYWGWALDSLHGFYDYYPVASSVVRVKGGAVVAKEEAL